MAEMTKTNLRNAIIEIHPYWHKGAWVFDDERVGLVQEPFVAGVPEMIRHLVKDIPNAEKGFRMQFSALPYPTFKQQITRMREEYGGNWYRMAESPYLEGWLCPALFEYFQVAPEKLYVNAEELPLAENK
tara:strand:- start:2917 stop:3306 length:390 start_codon:yes stop_codon:yes gene_type:complete